MNKSVMKSKIWVAILATIFLPKLASPKVNMLGVSLRVAKNLCASVQPDETFGSMSDKWTTKKCAWALNRESWTSSKGKKGIWQLGCSKDSGNKGSRVDNDKDCVDPCENINPISLPDDKPNENLYETCEYGAFKSSLYCRNYQFCNHSSTEKSDAHLWTEIVCPKHLYWHPEEQRCANFSVLPIKTKEEYCAQDCIPVCSKGTPKHIRKGQKDTPPFEDGQQQCRNNSWDWCRLMERRNNTDYCRNYQECQINETGGIEWIDIACRRDRYYYQTELCMGSCVLWDELPYKLQEYYRDYMCCPTPPRTYTTKPIITSRSTRSTTTTTTTTTSTTPSTRPISTTTTTPRTPSISTPNSTTTTTSTRSISTTTPSTTTSTTTRTPSTTTSTTTRTPSTTTSTTTRTPSTTTSTTTRTPSTTTSTTTRTPSTTTSTTTRTPSTTTSTTTRTPSTTTSTTTRTPSTTTSTTTKTPSTTTRTTTPTPSTTTSSTTTTSTKTPSTTTSTTTTTPRTPSTTTPRTPSTTTPRTPSTTTPRTPSTTTPRTPSTTTPRTPSTTTPRTPSTTTPRSPSTTTPRTPSTTTPRTPSTTTPRTPSTTTPPISTPTTTPTRSTTTTTTTTPSKPPISTPNSTTTTTPTRSISTTTSTSTSTTTSTRSISTTTSTSTRSISTPNSTTTTTPRTPSTTTSTTTTTKGSTPSRPPGYCQCLLYGYCDTYQLCTNGTWGPRIRCRRDLFWLPNTITGGACVHFNTLPDYLKKQYLADPHCNKCIWYQKKADECSPRYTFRHTNGTEYDMTCPPPPIGQKQLFWQLDYMTCASCRHCVYNNGRRCDNCP